MEPEPRFLGKKQLEPEANQLSTSGSNPGYPELSWNRVWFLESEQNENWIILFYFFEKSDQELDSWFHNAQKPKGGKDTRPNPKLKAMF
jgi:hypothetical protein